MHTRSIARAGAGLAAAVALTLTGCTGEAATPGSGGSGAAAEDAATTLVAATTALEATSYRFELELGEMMSSTGAIDPAEGVGTSLVTVSDEGTVGELELELLFTPTDLWLGIGDLGTMLGLTAPWMHVDLARLESGNVMGFGPGANDPAGAAELLEELENVTKVDDRTYRGEVDLTQVEGSAMADAGAVEALGDEARSVPVTVTLDDAERLDTVTMELPPMPDVPAQTLTVRYHDYGTDVAVVPPADDQVAPAPDELYGLFSGGFTA